MKRLTFILTIIALLAGCTSAPIAMKTDRKFFKPVRTFAQAKQTKSTNRYASAKIVEQELAEKNATIQLLKKENKELRERIARLEKRLSITQSKNTEKAYSQDSKLL